MPHEIVKANDEVLIEVTRHTEHTPPEEPKEKVQEEKKQDGSA